VTQESGLACQGKAEPIPNQWTNWYDLAFSACNSCGREYIGSVADMFAA
jgi:hypothetical protein